MLTQWLAALRRDAGADLLRVNDILTLVDECVRGNA